MWMGCPLQLQSNRSRRVCRRKSAPSTRKFWSCGTTLSECGGTDRTGRSTIGQTCTCCRDSWRSWKTSCGTLREFHLFFILELAMLHQNFELEIYLGIKIHPCLITSLGIRLIPSSLLIKLNKFRGILSLDWILYFDESINFNQQIIINELITNFSYQFISELQHASFNQFSLNIMLF